MVKQSSKDFRAEKKSSKESCCRMDAIISVDERGQMVLPKDLRNKLNIKSGDKFAVISCEKDGQVCCITLVKVDEFSDIIKGLLGPMLEGITGK